jgi:hypothetical protein
LRQPVKQLFLFVFQQSANEAWSLASERMLRRAWTDLLYESIGPLAEAENERRLMLIVMVLVVNARVQFQFASAHEPKYKSECEINSCSFYIQPCIDAARPTSVGDVTILQMQSGRNVGVQIADWATRAKYLTTKN